jgi:cbb3-type cytochrome oxidase subunit 3
MAAACTGRLAAGAGGAGGATGGDAAQPASIPTMAAPGSCHRSRFMVVILLEALGALLLLLLIVWWTMFSGRKKGELPPASPDDREDQDPGTR